VSSLDRFVDEYLPSRVPGYPCMSVPRWKNRVTQVDSGDEQVNQRWANPLHTYRLPEAIRTHAVFEDVHDHWMAMRGNAHTWPWRDPLDFASVALARPNVVPVTSGLDQTIGTGDGVTTSFQLTKVYVRGAQTYTRPIYLPVTATVSVLLDGADPAPVTWTASRPGGVVTFSSAPAAGVIVTAGFLFDVIVRFESDDSFEGMVKTYAASGVGDLTLLEVRSC